MIEKNIKNDEYYNFTHKENQNHIKFSPKRTIGTIYERRNGFNQRRWNYLNHLDNEDPTNQAYNFKKASYEIKRICSGLHLPQKFKYYFFEQYKKIWKRIPAGTKYRSPEKLIPPLIYILLKIEGFPINKNELLEISYMYKKEFNYFLLHARLIFPQYTCRDRKKYIFQKIIKFVQEYDLGMNIFHFSSDIFDKIIALLPCGTDDFYVSFILAIAILYYDLSHKITINQVCMKNNTMMSTVQKRFEILLESYQKKNFNGIISSRELILRQLKKLNIIND